MPLFRYQAVVTSGKKISGIIEADSLSIAKERLRQQKMAVTDVAPYTSPQRKNRIPFAQLLDLTQMVSKLLQAGIPLYETLEIMAEKFRKFSFHPVVVDLCDRVKKGESLSSSLACHKQIFDPIYISMVKAGEESGALGHTFQQLVELLKDKGRLKKQLLAATTYPLFLGSFCIVVFVALLVWVIPSLKNLFGGQALHPLTKFVFAASDLFLNHSILIFSAAVLFALFLIFAFTHPKLRTFWDLCLLKLPLVGPAVLLAATIRFCRTCSLLLEGGAPLLLALELSRSTLKNRTLESAFVQVEKKITEGGSLSKQIENTRLMPPLVFRMLAIGETTGQNASMLKHIATLCEDDLSGMLHRYTTLLQPLLLLVLGLLIGVVVLSILIPLTDVGSMLQG